MIARLREMLAAATPGPWWRDDRTGAIEAVDGSPVHWLPSREDAALIVAMHEALPALLDVVGAAERVMLDVDDDGVAERDDVAVEALRAALSRLAATKETGR